MAANIDINDAHNRFTQKYIATLDWLYRVDLINSSGCVIKFGLYYFKCKPSSHDELFKIDKIATTTNMQIVPNIEKYPSI